MSCRFAQTGGRPAFLPTGNSGSGIAHCAAVKSPRPTQRSFRKWTTQVIHF